MLDAPKVPVLGRAITLIPAPASRESIIKIGGDHPQSAFFCNVHMLMLARKDAVLSEAMEQADLVFADGVPVAWLQSRLCRRKAAVVTGSDAVSAICERAALEDKRVGFLGSTPDVIAALASRLQRNWPGLSIAFTDSPGFTEPEVLSTDQDIERINEANLDYLFVGLGCPKQEKWIFRHKEQLNCSILGVGAAFDWLSGACKPPPRWMAKCGLGWMHRLVRNPGRLWRRYLVYNTAFVFAAATELVRHKSARAREAG